MNQAERESRQRTGYEQLEDLVRRLPFPIRQVITVFRFELGRTRTIPRMFVWSVLVMFPVAIMAIFRFQGGDFIPSEAWAMALYIMIPQVVCMLGLLLWVAPVIQAELEGRTWMYLAVRPGGKFSTLLGKYLNGVCWTASAALTGLTIGMLVGQPDVPDAFRLWLVLATLAIFSCLAYGAVYSVIGAFVHRRAMVVAVAYMLVFEVVLSHVPAVINKFTVEHRLFNLLNSWTTVLDSLPNEPPFQFSTQPAWMHVLILMTYIVAVLGIAAIVVRYREYVTADES